MKTTIEIKGQDGVVTAFIEGEEIPAGIMQFEIEENNRMIITHTITTPGFEGRGVGKTLVKAGVAYAKQNGYTIVPVCSFAKAVIEKLEL